MRNKLLLKIAVIALTTAILLIPLSMVRSTILERGHYRALAVADISATWTGSQQVTGPVLAVPYRYTKKRQRWNEDRNEYEERVTTHDGLAIFMPESLAVTATVATDVKQRGIYGIPVYTATIDMSGTIDLSQIEALKSRVDGFTSFGQPTLNVAVTDVRGIGARPEIRLDGVALPIRSGTDLPELGDGIRVDVSRSRPGELATIQVGLELRGTEALSFAPVAEESTLAMHSSWPHPRFGGRFLPATRTISDDGFEATWRISSLAAGFEKRLRNCSGGHCNALAGSGFSVQLVDPVDLYATVLRAAKYGVLFVVLTFTAFFLTETLSRHPLHPVQYGLVGASLVIFYLLLMALAEHTGFVVAYLVATLACCALLLAYLRGVFDNGRMALAYSGGLAVLYAMLFAILRSEDFAMLMGTLLLFGLLALTMLTTRDFDWYQLGERLDDPISKSPARARA